MTKTSRVLRMRVRAKSSSLSSSRLVHDLEHSTVWIISSARRHTVCPPTCVTLLIRRASACAAAELSNGTPPYPRIKTIVPGRSQLLGQERTAKTASPETSVGSMLVPATRTIKSWVRTNVTATSTIATPKRDAAAPAIYEASEELVAVLTVLPPPFHIARRERQACWRALGIPEVMILPFSNSAKCGVPGTAKFLKRSLLCFGATKMVARVSGPTIARVSFASPSLTRTKSGDRDWASDAS